jgi:hypothetical protein
MRHFLRLVWDNFACLLVAVLLATVSKRTRRRIADEIRRDDTEAEREMLRRARAPWLGRG